MVSSYSYTYDVRKEGRRQTTAK